MPSGHTSTTVSRIPISAVLHRLDTVLPVSDDDGRTNSIFSENVDSLLSTVI
ncbi:unnamed protein product [Nippostrongylus brasiliensis]|uniref:Uncharacterized protein n=1 Tax=Nippostrongylus brasiliensis TaxID=27835 RepID=A0A0N4YHR0_NIPBR|nr:unnamed protein product [Nippostrongylus brasiliensis]